MAKLTTYRGETFSAQFNVLDRYSGVNKDLTGLHVAAKLMYENGTKQLASGFSSDNSLPGDITIDTATEGLVTLTLSESNTLTTPLGFLDLHITVGANGNTTICSYVETEFLELKDHALKGHRFL